MKSVLHIPDSDWTLQITAKILYEFLTSPHKLLLISQNLLNYRNNKGRRLRIMKFLVM